MDCIRISIKLLLIKLICKLKLAALEVILFGTKDMIQTDTYKDCFFRVKSAQQLMGSLVKTYLPRKLGIDPARVSHITLMPCFDKKLEASRDDFLNAETGIKVVLS